MNEQPTTAVGMEVVTVAAQGTRKPGLRAVQAVGAVLAGVLLSSCGQPAQGDDNAGAPAPPTEQNSGTAGTGGGSETPPDPAPGNGGTPPSTHSPAPSSSEPAPSSSAENNADERRASGPERCHTSMLSGNLRPSDPGAGQRYAELVLTNTSRETCTLYGYGGLQLVDSNGAPLSTNLTRDERPGPTMITLDPNGSANKLLHWSAVPHGDEPTDGPCQPEPSGARVIPPDETDPVAIDWNLGPVCGFGSIGGSAYHQ